MQSPKDLEPREGVHDGCRGSCYSSCALCQDSLLMTSGQERRSSDAHSGCRTGCCPQREPLRGGRLRPTTDDLGERAARRAPVYSSWHSPEGRGPSREGDVGGKAPPPRPASRPRLSQNPKQECLSPARERASPPPQAPRRPLGEDAGSMGRRQGARRTQPPLSAGLVPCLLPRPRRPCAWAHRSPPSRRAAWRALPGGPGRDVLPPVERGELGPAPCMFGVPLTPRCDRPRRRRLALISRGAPCTAVAAVGFVGLQRA